EEDSSLALVIKSVSGSIKPTLRTVARAEARCVAPSTVGPNSLASHALGKKGATILDKDPRYSILSAVWKPLATATQRLVSAPPRRFDVARLRGARVDEVTRDTHSPEEVSGRRTASQGRPDRENDQRVRAHQRRSRAGHQDRAGSFRHS